MASHVYDRQWIKNHFSPQGLNLRYVLCSLLELPFTLNFFILKYLEVQVRLLSFLSAPARSR